MDDSGRVEIEIVLDDGSVRQGFARVLSTGKSTASELETAFSSIKNILLAIAAVDLSFRAVKSFFSNAIEQSAEQEVAINRLNNALSMAGTYTAQASQSFQDMAEQIQKTTTIEDDQVLSLAAVARSMTKTNEQAMALTKASIDLGVATGKGPDEALQQLAGTLSGTAGRLAKTIPALQNFTTAQLRAGAALDYVKERFKGAASGETNTYKGAIIQLGNSWNDLVKQVGKFITQSPALVVTIKFISEKFTKMAEGLSKSRGGFDVMKVVLQTLINAGRMLNDYVIYPLERIWIYLKTISIGFAEMIKIIQEFAQTVDLKIAKMLPKSIADKIFDIEKMKERKAETTFLVDELGKQLAEQLGDLGKSSLSEGIGKTLDELDERIKNAHPFKPLKDDLENTATDMNDTLTSLSQSFELMRDGASDSMSELALHAKKSFNEIGGAAMRVLVGGVATGMAAIGRALVKGENIFQAFAGAMLSALGQAAVQMGAMYILMGVARKFSSYGLDATAWGLIATGTAMSVLGGALMAVGEGVSGGGGAGAGASVGGGGGGSVGSFDQGQTPDQSLKGEEDRARVTVNIQGHVFDAKETGLRIVEIVQDAFDTSGARLVVT